METASAADALTEVVKTADLKPHPRNYRRHPEDQLDHIAASLSEHGQYRNVVVAVDNTILAGHGVWEAATKRLGWEEIVVKRLDVEPSSPAALKVLTGDNEMGRLAETDPQILAQHLGAIAELDDLLGTGFDALALDFLRASLAERERPVRDADAVPEAPKGEAKSGRGEIYELGPHRLLCGDATDPDSYAALMQDDEAQVLFTDPPYGVAYTGGSKKREALAGDERGTGIYDAFLTHAVAACARDAAFYIWYADLSIAAAAAAAAGLHVRCQIIWVKNQAQFASAAHYHGKHEPCIYAGRVGGRIAWHGPTNEVTVWDANRSPRNDFHPTQKPVELAERALANSSARGDIVLDPFGGGGSTLIAADRSGRRARMIEVDPCYCDVIRQRYADFTGQPQHAP